MAKHKRFVCYTHVEGYKTSEPTWFMVKDDDYHFDNVIGLSGPYIRWRSLGDLSTDKPGGRNDGVGRTSNTRFWTDDVHDLSDAAVAALMKLELLAKEGTS